MKKYFTYPFLNKHKHLILLFLFIAIYILYYAIASFLRYDNFYTGKFDLGNMDQTVWNTLQGRVFQLTNPDGTTTVSRLSIHADFILAIVSPLYLIWSHPKMLLLLQTVVLALGAIFVYKIALNKIKDKTFSLVFAASYLLYPAVGFVNLYDFHPVALATTFLLAAFYFFINRKLLLFTIFMFLAGTTKEEVWALASIFGFWILIRNYLQKERIGKELLFGVLLMLGGISASYVLIDKIIPLFKGADHFALDYYSHLGSSTGELLINILLNPHKVISLAFEDSRLTFLKQLFMPLGFLSLLSPLVLIFALPDLLISILSSNPALHQIYYQYTAVITPFMFISAIYTSRLILTRFKRIKPEFIAIYILFFTLLAAYITGPLPGSKRPNIDMFTKQLEHKEEIENFLQSIPKNYKVAATNNVGSHLTQREYIFTIPKGMGEADYLIFLTHHGWTDSAIYERRAVDRLKLDDRFNLVYENKNFYAFKARK